MTMSSADYVEEWFETPALLLGTLSASGIIGTFLGSPLAGLGVRHVAPLHGRDRRPVPGLGLPPRRHGRRGRGPVPTPPGAFGAEIRTEAPVERDRWCEGGRAVGRGARRQRRRDPRPDVVVSSADPRLRTFREAGLEPEHLELRSFWEAIIDRYKIRGSSAQGESLALDALPELSRASSRIRRADESTRQYLSGRHSRSVPDDRVPRAGLRRRQVRPVLAPSPYMDIVHAVTASTRTMAPSGKHVMSIFVASTRSVRARGRHLGGAAGSLRRRGGRHPRRSTFRT